VPESSELAQEVSINYDSGIQLKITTGLGTIIIDRFCGNCFMQFLVMSPDPVEDKHD